MSNKLFMHDFGPMLIENGYNIIPVVQGTKRPALANWPKIKATPELIESWDADCLDRYNYWRSSGYRHRHDMTRRH